MSSATSRSGGLSPRPLRQCGRDVTVGVVVQEDGAFLQVRAHGYRPGGCRRWRGRVAVTGRLSGGVLGAWEARALYRWISLLVVRVDDRDGLAVDDEGEGVVPGNDGNGLAGVDHADAE